MWNPPCFITDIVILHPVNGLLPCQEQRSVPKKIEEFPIKAYYIQKQFFQMGKITDEYCTSVLFDEEKKKELSGKRRGLAQEKKRFKEIDILIQRTRNIY